MNEKQLLRQTITNIKRTYTENQLRIGSLDVCRQLFRHQKVHKAKTLLLYHAMPDEPDLQPLINRLVKDGRQILLPVVTGESTMEVRSYTGPQNLLESTHFHIMEPIGTAFTELCKVDVALIPGIAFDAFGHRLGRGKGYYDRFLKLMPQVYKIGVGFDFQKTDHIPTGKYDVMMNETCFGHIGK